MLHQYLQGELILRNLNELECYNFFPKGLHLVNYFVEQFLSEIDLASKQLIKVTAPDGTIPIKPFDVR